jgi:hypothetical protein
MKLCLFLGWCAAWCVVGCSQGPSDARHEASGGSNGGSTTTSGGSANAGTTSGGTSTSAGGSTSNGGTASGGALSSGGGGAASGGDAAGGDSAGGTLGTDDYNPCPPAGTPCVILPLGDSITYGDGSTDFAGYRSRLFHLTLESDESVTFVGGMQDGPDTVDGVPFPKHHQGHSGYEIAGDHGIMPFTEQVIQVTAPDIVLLMIGTNDLAFNNDPPNAPNRLGELLDLITDTDPELLLVVAQIVPTNEAPTNVGVEAFNAEIPAVVASRQSNGKHVTLVDMYGAFTENPNFATEYMDDKYHPNDTGYAKMAEVWHQRIGPLLE